MLLLLQIYQDLTPHECSCFIEFVKQVGSLYPSQHFFSHVGTSSWVEPKDKAEGKVSCSRTQHSASGEAPTRNPLISSQAFYHFCNKFNRRLSMNVTRGIWKVCSKVFYLGNRLTFMFGIILVTYFPRCYHSIFMRML